MASIAALASALLMFAAPAPASDALSDRDATGSLRDFIIAYLDGHRDQTFERDPTIKVAVAKTVLGPNDPDGYVIYIRSGGWCGSGGCHALIVSRRAGRFQPLAFECCIEPPIMIERPNGASVNAKLVFTTNHPTDGLKPFTLTRQGDAYDCDAPCAGTRNDDPLTPLISEKTPLVTLY